MRFEKTAGFIEQMVIDKIMPGASYAIIESDFVYQNVIGDLQWFPQKKPLKSNLYYDIASLTKVVGTTMAILKLLVSGQLDLEHKITRFLPNCHYKKIRIRHLLTHTSGLTGYIENRDNLNAADLKKALLAQLSVGPDFENKMVYQDVNFLILGWIVEVITDLPIQDYITSAIIQPLELTETTFKPEPANCVPTHYDQINGLTKGIVHDPKTRVLANHSGSAGLFSTLSDLIKFSKLLLGITKSQKNIIPETTLNHLYRDWTKKQVGRSLGWRCLPAADNDHHTLLYQTGFTGCLLLLDAKHKTGLILLSNRVHPIDDNQIFLKKRQELIALFLSENKTD